MRSFYATTPNSHNGYEKTEDVHINANSSPYMP